MSKLTSALKAASSAYFGTGVWGTGGIGGSPASGASIIDPVVGMNLIDGMSVGDLYETQPHLRTVVSFVARNGAQLGRHVYTKDSRGNRKRATSGSAVTLLERPNEYQTGYDLFNMLLTELALYDFALWVPRMSASGDWMVDPIPTAWITGVQSADAFRVEKYWIQAPGEHKPHSVLAKDVVVFRGYNAKGFKKGSSAVEALRDTLSEQVSAMQFRRQMWQRGGRVGMFMSRPAEAPEWSPEAKAKFIQNWKNSWAGSGSNAGSTPLLEDGMELKRIGFNAKEEQWLEAATLSLVTVAGEFHVPPAMVGVSGYNSFASVKEFRKMLYTETMGPTIAQVEDTINIFLFPLIEAPKGQFLELNIAEKLQGDFDEQAEQLFKAVGGPYMTVNEARKIMNMPEIEGGDELLAPLNMGAVGNQGAEADVQIDPGATETEPHASDPPDPSKAHVAQVTRSQKAPSNRVPTHEQGALEISLRAYFGRQGKAVSASLGTKDPAWWNQKEWNRELSAILLPHMTSMSAGVARKAAGAEGLDPDAYSIGQTANFLKAVADSRADLINSTTRDEVQSAIAENRPVDQVFKTAQEARAPQASKTMSTFLAGWATTEMARQLLADKAPTKTWESSGLANSRHSAMNGQTVGINEKFSNGADWPGDPDLGASEVANCGCGVRINY